MRGEGIVKMIEKEAGYKSLEVWKLSVQMVKAIYELTRQFPKEELYGITSQIRRAAISIPSNIAEGNSRRNKKEFQQYLFIALGSLSELETQLVISFELGYVADENVYRTLCNTMNKLRAMVLNLIRSFRTPRGTWSVVRSTEEISA